jgi:hypothetical protein
VHDHLFGDSPLSLSDDGVLALCTHKTVTLVPLQALGEGRGGGNNAEASFQVGVVLDSSVYNAYSRV